MPKLPEATKNMVRIHLGYTLDAVPDGDAYVLEDRMDNVRNQAEITWIKKLVVQCDKAWERMFVDSQKTGVARITNIIGDINRTETTNIAESLKTREQAYEMAVKLLGQQLAVKPYRYVSGARLSAVENRRRSLPRGPADTSRTDKIYLSRRYA